MGSLTAALPALLVLVVSWALTATMGIRYVGTYERRYGFVLNQLSFHLIVGVAGLILAIALSPHPVIAATVCAVVPVVVLSSMVDALANRLPGLLTFIAGMMVAVGIIIQGFYIHKISLIFTCLGFGIFAFLAGLAVFMSRLSIGFGDVMLLPVMISLAATLGSTSVLVAFVAIGVLGGLYGVVTLSKNDGKPASEVTMAYGPWIVIGTLVTMAVVSVVA